MPHQVQGELGGGGVGQCRATLTPAVLEDILAVLVSRLGVGQTGLGGADTKGGGTVPQPNATTEA